MLVVLVSIVVAVVAEVPTVLVLVVVVVVASMLFLRSNRDSLLTESKHTPPLRRLAGPETGSQPICEHQKSQRKFDRRKKRDVGMRNFLCNPEN